jgi:hypothetical protein
MRQIILKIDSSNYFEIISTCTSSQCEYSYHDEAIISLMYNSNVYDLGSTILAIPTDLFEGGCEGAFTHDLSIDDPENIWGYDKYDYIHVHDRSNLIEGAPEFKNTPIKKE